MASVQAVPVAQPAPTYPAAAAPSYGVPPPKHPTATYAGAIVSTRSVGKLSLMTSLLRFLQVVFAVIGLSIMASAKVDDTDFDWKFFKAYKFCLSMLVIVFVWALILAILDALEAFARFTVGGGLKPFLVAIGDLILAFLLFGAACAAATIDTDVLPQIDGLPGKFSSRVRAATAFAFLTWLVLVPTMVINLALVASEFFSS